MAALLVVDDVVDARAATPATAPGRAGLGDLGRAGRAFAHRAPDGTVGNPVAVTDDHRAGSIDL